jgi:quercetin dioxygenase-like cupin family protein
VIAWQLFLKGDSMKCIYLLLGITLAVGSVLGLLGSRMLSAQEPLKSGTVLQRTELKSAKGMEAILVLRNVPPGGESGKHTQSGNEIVYILEGSVILEVQGKPSVNLKAGEAFQTVAGEVHNVKNASASAPAKALAFYIATKGTRLEDLSLPAK